jgi:hypothetical protein
MKSIKMLGDVEIRGIEIEVPDGEIYGDWFEIDEDGYEKDGHEKDGLEVDGDRFEASD